MSQTFEINKTTKFNMKIIWFSLLFIILLGSCQKRYEGKVIAFVGAKLINGTKTDPIKNSILLIHEGKVVDVGTTNEVTLPDNAQIIDATGKYIMPGIINAHGHIGGTEGLKGGKYSRANVIRDLKLNASYGITTVVSLGGDGQASFDIRNQQNTKDLKRSRLFVAGDIVVGNEIEKVIKTVDKNANNKADFIKIRVDDNLGVSNKMPKDIYEAIINRTHEKNLRLASHLYYLEDAKSLLKVGTDYIAHSIRDQEVDEEVIQLMLEKEVPYCPTLMREVSTYVYENRPAFFDDPFFLKSVDQEILTALQDSARQKRIQNSERLQSYKTALKMAQKNLKVLADKGVNIVMGTDSGPAGRFQGYFEHQELQLMEEAGLTPEQIIYSATGGAAKALQLKGIGTLEKGNWGDLIILDKDPLKSIVNTTSISSVWIAGNKIQ